MVTVLGGAAFYTTFGAQPSNENALESMVRVGTFDSRAVAMAYYRSEAFNREAKDLKAAHEKAKAAGDEKRVEELEQEGRAQQALMHKQGFGTWPVNNILAKITDELPGIATQAGVDIIISKWEIVYQRSGIEFIDVTDRIVRPFNPDARTLEIIHELQKLDPVLIEHDLNKVEW